MAFAWPSSGTVDRSKENEIMRFGVLCLLLLPGCWSSYQPTEHEYALTWTCVSPEGCERAEEVEQIDGARRVRSDVQLINSQDESFGADAKVIGTGALPRGCSWLYFLTVFGHELERSRMCFAPGGFELDLAIPNQDPTTYSLWLVEGRDVNLL
jgi:hypothetical protein